MYFDTLTKTEVCILKFLLSKPSLNLSIREIAKKIGQDYKITHDSVKKLAKKEIIEMKKQANINLCRINLGTNPGLLSYIEYLRANEFLNRHRDIKLIIGDLLDKASLHSFVLILFGSYAREKYEKKSDVDLLFLIPDRRFEKEIYTTITTVERVTPVGIHEIIITYDNFMEMLKEKKTNVAKEVLENHIIFYGAETFYRLLKTIE